MVKVITLDMDKGQWLAWKETIPKTTSLNKALRNLVIADLVMTREKNNPDNGSYDM